MGWASGYIKQLLAGETVKFRPVGNSMTPRVKSGQLCTVEPVDFDAIADGDIVLCKVKGNDYLHLVKGKRDGRLQIGNMHGHVNGWAGPKQVFGKLTKIEP